VHPVLGQLGYVRATVRERPAPTPRHELRDRLQHFPAGVDPGQGHEAGGRLVLGATQRQLQLVAGVGVDRELEVPARVGTADAAAQREPGPCQPQVGGVEVGRVQLELVLRSDGETEQLRRIGQLELRRGLVLAFRLAHPSPHAQWLPSAGRIENGRVKGAHSGH